MSIPSGVRPVSCKLLAEHDPKVPPGASIMAHEDYIPEPGAGTVGCYCSISGDDRMYSLTAGHVARPIVIENTIDVYAPASKPFAKAVKTTQVEYELARISGVDAQTRKREWKRFLAWIVTLRKRFIPPHTLMKNRLIKKIDFALIHVNYHRAADNHVDRIPVLAQDFEFLERGCSLTEVTDPIKLGEEVVKVGIHTGFSKGRVIEDAKVRWNPESAGPLNAEITMPDTILILMLM
jgi:hypothetical protein